MASNLSISLIRVPWSTPRRAFSHWSWKWQSLNQTYISSPSGRLISMSSGYNGGWVRPTGLWYSHFGIFIPAGDSIGVFLAYASSTWNMSAHLLNEYLPKGSHSKPGALKKYVSPRHGWKMLMRLYGSATDPSPPMPLPSLTLVFYLISVTGWVMPWCITLLWVCIIAPLPPPISHICPPYPLPKTLCDTEIHFPLQTLYLKFKLC